MNKIIKPQVLKGFRDFLPEQAIVRNRIIEKIKKVFEKYGFDPLETPALEYAETLLGKYGDEADKMIYLFEDKGKRKIGLKYDQTVPLARIISQYQNIPKPFKRYQIQSVWRAENTQKGRFREFTQCDIDIVGVEDIYADGEIISCVLETVKTLGFKNVKMLINDRAVFKNIDLKYITVIDKLKKIGNEGVMAELVKNGMKSDEALKLLDSFNKKTPTKLLMMLFENLEKNGFKNNLNFQFSPTLARGLDYYTGTIFELVSDDYQSGSLGGGGRYDKLIGNFTGSDSPAVGFAFGFDRLIEAINELNLIQTIKTSSQLLVTVFSENYYEESLSFINYLRKNEINTEINLIKNQSLDKQFKYADNKGIPYVVIIGPEEVKQKGIKLKDLRTGEQRSFKKEDLLNFLKKKLDQ